MVACVFRIDGDKRDVAQIGAARNVRRFGVFNFAYGLRAKLRRYAMRMNGDEADRFRLVHGPEAFGNARPGKARSAPRERFDDHQLAA